jgi:hypothetical protein
VWFLQLDGGQLVPVSLECGPACDPAPWHVTIGTVSHADGPAVTGGLYCAPTDGSGPTTLIGWKANADDPTSILETRYVLKDRLLVEVGSPRIYTVPGPEAYPPNGMTDLCGSTAFAPG